MHLRPAPPGPAAGILCISSIFLAGTDSLHETASQRFHAKSTAPCTYVFIPIFYHSPPRTRLSVSPLSPYFLALAVFFMLLSFIFLPSCIPQTCPWTAHLLGFLLYPSMSSPLRYPTLLQLTVLFLSPVQLYQLWMATLFLARSLLYIASATFTRLSLPREGTFPVLLLEL